ncbi:hypothetical protein [Aeromonas veronii]|uniref:hypothetical protein n=1 Tax=Aeromonas veronii TaxID=654 RepID=UPI003D1D2C75
MRHPAPLSASAAPANESRRKPIRAVLLAVGLALPLVGCATATRPPCDPTPPRLVWFETQGGILIPDDQLAELVTFLDDLRRCAD